MATANELLSSVDEQVFIIDADLRTIIIPSTITNLGVESDDEVLRIPFRMPAHYCGIDLSTFVIRINYLNANNEPDVYEVTDSEVQLDDTITFSWLVGRHAAEYKGDVHFIVCLKDIDDSGIVLREFNTTVATLPILEGLETEKKIVTDYFDILEQWKKSLFKDSIGKVSPDGTSVIFNDTDTNVAGTKAFRILSGSPTVDGGVYHLDSVEGLEIGMTFTLHLYDPADDGDNARYDDFGTITDIRTFKAGLPQVSVSNYTAYSYGENAPDEFHEKSYFRISGRPDLGTEWLEGYAFVGGTENKAIGRGSAVFGKGSVANDACALVGGRECYANYAGTASGWKNKAIGQRSTANVGDGNKAYGTDSDVGGVHCESSKEAVASFVRGWFLKAVAKAQAVVGSFNKVLTDAKFIVGIGTSEKDRRNGLVVYDDGCVEIAGKVSADGINLNDTINDAISPIIQTDKLPSKGKTNKIYCAPAENDSVGKLFDKYLWMNLGRHYDALYSDDKVWNGTIIMPHEGDGTEESPYEITCAEELAYVVRSGGGFYYKLTTDIYLNNPNAVNWQTGDINNRYTVKEWPHSETADVYNPMRNGTVIDGNGFFVYGLYRNGKDTAGGEDGCALIPSIESGATITIKNLGIDNAYIKTSSQTGVLFAIVNNAKAIVDNVQIGENVTVADTTAGNGAGILVGYGYGSGANVTAINCAVMNGSGLGLFGKEFSATRTAINCYIANGSITTCTRAANIVTAKNCYATAGEHGTIITIDQMQGPNALNNMLLGEAYQTTKTYPMLTTFAYGWELI